MNYVYDEAKCFYPSNHVKKDATILLVYINNRKYIFKDFSLISIASLKQFRFLYS